MKILEIPETPPGRLADFLIGDLGPARRHLARIAEGDLPPVPAVIEEIRASIERCVRRIERDIRPRDGAQT